MKLTQEQYTAIGIGLSAGIVIGVTIAIVCKMVTCECDKDDG